MPTALDSSPVSQQCQIVAAHRYMIHSLSLSLPLWGYEYFRTKFLCLRSRMGSLNISLKQSDYCSPRMENYDWIYAVKLSKQQSLADSVGEVSTPPTARSLARFPLPKRSENLKWKNHLLLKKLTSAENGKSINLKRAWWYSSPASFYSSRAITEMYANLIFMLQTTFAPVMLEHCQVKVRKAFRCSVQKERMETKHYSFILEEDKLEEHFKPKFHLPRYITLDRAVSW